jgi:hypothetical protein
MKPVEIRVRFRPHYKLHITVTDAFLLHSLKGWFETVDKLVFRITRKTGEHELRRETQVVSLWTEVSPNTIALDAGMIDFFSQWIAHSVDKTVYKVDCTTDLPDVSPVQLSSHWKSILKPQQQDDVTGLTQGYCGLAAQHTGYGKTLILLAILDCLPGRSLILVPNNSILKDVQLRGEQFGVPIPKYDWDAERNILNPVGFLHSKDRENLRAAAWLTQVKNVFTDEAHYLKAQSWGEMFSVYLPNVQRAYGFSASPDSAKGADLSPMGTVLRKIGSKNAKIIGLSGTTRVIRKSTAGVTLVEIFAEVSSENLVEFGYDTWQDALSHMLKRPLLSRIIGKVFERFPATKFYMPVHKISEALSFYERLRAQGYNGVFWSAKKTVPEPPSGLSVLEHVKALMSQSEYQFLISTSLGFEGIDIPALSGIIPLIGKSYRMILQPAGRSSRGGSLVYVIIYDKHNRVMMRQSKERRKQIVKEYPIDHKIQLRIEERI